MPQARAKYPLIEAFLCAGLLILILFFDVIFLGASLLPSDMFNEIQVNPNPELSSILPHINGRVITDGYSDIGAAAWQFEPGIRWMAYNIWNGQSPYWNPYSASGSLGPETLVDSKFSVFTLAVGVLGGGSAAFHFVLMLLLLTSCTSLYLVFKNKLKMHMLAAIFGCCVFLINGFSNTNMHAQMGLPYYFAPILLLSLMCLVDKASFRNFSLAVITHAFCMSCTFLPILLLVLSSAHLLSLAYAYSISSAERKFFRALWLQVASSILGFLLLAPLYFPIIESFFVVDLFSTYNSRAYYPLPLSSIFSWFSAKHFWESYNGLKPEGFDPGKYASIFFHMGTVVLFFAFQGIALAGDKFRKLDWMALFLVLIGLGRIFNFFPFSLIQYLPGFRVIFSLYWFSMLTIGALILTARGVEKNANGYFSLKGYLCFELLHWISFYYLFSLFGWPQNERLQLFIYLHLGLSAVVLALACGIPLLPTQRKLLSCVLILLACCELVFYRNHLRPYRYELSQNLPARVQFLKSNLKGYRLLNIGRNGSLYPEWGAALQIPEVSTMNSSTLPWYNQFYRDNFGNDVTLWLALGWNEQREPTINQAGLDLASVRYIMVQDYLARYLDFFRKNRYPVKFKGNGVHIFENKDKLPRAYVVNALSQSKFTPERNGLDIRKFASSGDSQLIEKAKSLGVSIDSSEQTSNLKSEVRFEDYNNASMQIRAKLDSPGILVITDSWHPNWKAYVDGSPAYLGIVNQAFRGLALPAGEHKIELSYKPATLDLACLCSALILLGLLLSSVPKLRAKLGFLKIRATA